MTFFLNPVASFQKFGQSSECSFPVAYLGPALGRLGDEASGEVPHPHPGIGGIAVLTARSRTTEKFEFQL